MVKIKPLDVLMIIVLLLASFTPVFVFASGKTKGTEAVLKHNGQVIKAFSLTQDTTYTYDNHGAICEVEIKNNQARIAYANCPDNICVKTSWISKPGQTAICLPHGNVLSISGSNGPTKEDGKIVDYNG